MLALIVASYAPALLGQQSFSNYIRDGLYQFDDTLKLSRKDLFTNYKSQFGLGVYDSMFLWQTHSFDTMGGVGDTYVQLYKGYVVEPTMMNVMSKYGVVLQANGFKINSLNIDVSSPITEVTALANALLNIDADMYPWKDTAMIDTMINRAYADGDTALALSIAATGFDPPKGELVINTAFQDTNIHNPSHYSFCWKFVIPTMKWDTIMHVDSLADSTGTYYESDTTTFIGYCPSRTHVIYIDATTGDYFTDYSQVFGGSYTMENCVTQYNGTRAVWDYRKGLARKWLFDDYSINGWDFGSGGYVNTSIKRSDTWYGTGASAYWAIERAWLYYKYVHGMEGSNFHKFPIGIIKDYPYTSIYGETDAAYDPNFGSHSYTSSSIYFGSGWPKGETEDIIEVRPDNSDPFGSASGIDLMGHELTHAYIHGNKKLDIGTEALAINEALCDFYGMVVHNWFLTAGTYGTPTSTSSISNWGIGWFSSSFFRHFSLMHHDYPSASWEYYNDPFVSSPDKYALGGTIRHFLGLLTAGGSYRGYTVPAQGIGVVEQDAFVTMTWWIYSSINMHDFKDAYLAENAWYYTKCKDRWKAAASAFQAVNLGPVPLCPLVAVTTPMAVLKPMVGQNLVKLSASSTDGGLTPISFNWQLPANWTVSYNNDHSEFSITSVGGDWSSKSVKCVVVFPGGVIDSGIAAIHFVDSGFGARFAPNNPNTNKEKITEAQIFPNPTSDMVNILLPEEPVNAIMRLFEISGKEVYSKTITSSRSAIYLPALKNGMYLLRVMGDNVRVNKNIIIQQAN